jgi:hypothetical protein
MVPQLRQEIAQQGADDDEDQEPTWRCSCGYTTTTVDDGGIVYSVQCGCSREMMVTK